MKFKAFRSKENPNFWIISIGNYATIEDQKPVYYTSDSPLLLRSDFKLETVKPFWDKVSDDLYNDITSKFDLVDVELKIM